MSKAEIDTINASIATTGQVGAGVGATDLLNLGSIFSHFLHPQANAILEGTSSSFPFATKLLLFPFAAVFAILDMIITWRAFHLNRMKAKAENGKFDRELLGKGIINTIAAVGVVGAVIIALAGGAALALVGPIAFTAILGAKTIISAILSVKHLIQGFMAKGEDRANHFKTAKNEGIGTLIGALATLAVVGVMLLHIKLFAISAVVGAAIGIGFSIYNIVKIQQGKNAAAAAASTAEESKPLMEDKNDPNPDSNKEQVKETKLELTGSDEKIQALTKQHGELLTKMEEKLDAIQKIDAIQKNLGADTSTKDLILEQQELFQLSSTEIKNIEALTSQIKRMEGVLAKLTTIEEAILKSSTSVKNNEVENIPTEKKNKIVRLFRKENSAQTTVPSLAQFKPTTAKQIKGLEMNKELPKNFMTKSL